MQPNVTDAVMLIAFTDVLYLHLKTPIKKGAPRFPASARFTSVSGDRYLTPNASPLTIAVTLPEAKVAALVVSVTIRYTGFSNLMG